MTAQRARLADGRLHLNHGPIDLIIEAFGESSEVEAGYAQAWARFGIWLVLGGVLYAVYGYRHSKLRRRA